jgi:hypothetical protein
MQNNVTGHILQVSLKFFVEVEPIFFIVTELIVVLNVRFTNSVHKDFVLEQ